MAVVIGSDDGDVIGGGAGPDELNGRGGNDVLFGGGGIDRLNGGTEDDVLFGEDGNDELNGEDGRDILFGGGGVDLLNGGAGDDIAFGGSGNDNVSGGAGNDILFGEDGADRLRGGAGNDIMFGGGGADRFGFGGALNRLTNVDTIGDFSTTDDRIELDNAIFRGLAEGALRASRFVNGTSAGDASDRIIYDRASGNLWFDADGTGASAKVLFAVLANQPVIDAGDFIVI